MGIVGSICDSGVWNQVKHCYKLINDGFTFELNVTSLAPGFFNGNCFVSSLQGIAARVFNAFTGGAHAPAITTTLRASLVNYDIDPENRVNPSFTPVNVTLSSPTMTQRDLVKVMQSFNDGFEQHCVIHFDDGTSLPKGWMAWHDVDNRVASQQDLHVGDCLGINIALESVCVRLGDNVITAVDARFIDANVAIAAARTMLLTAAGRGVAPIAPQVFVMGGFKGQVNTVPATVLVSDNLFPPSYLQNRFAPNGIDSLTQMAFAPPVPSFDVGPTRFFRGDVYGALTKSVHGADVEISDIATVPLNRIIPMCEEANVTLTFDSSSDAGANSKACLTKLGSNWNARIFEMLNALQPSWRLLGGVARFQSDLLSFTLAIDCGRLASDLSSKVSPFMAVVAGIVEQSAKTQCGLDVSLSAAPTNKPFVPLHPSTPAATPSGDGWAVVLVIFISAVAVLALIGLCHCVSNCKSRYDQRQQNTQALARQGLLANANGTGVVGGEEPRENAAGYGAENLRREQEPPA